MMQFIYAGKMAGLSRTREQHKSQRSIVITLNCMQWRILTMLSSIVKISTSIVPDVLIAGNPNTILDLISRANNITECCAACACTAVLLAHCCPHSCPHSTLDNIQNQTISSHLQRWPQSIRGKSISWTRSCLNSITWKLFELDMLLLNARI